MSQTIETRLLLGYKDQASAGIKSVGAAFKGLAHSLVGYTAAFMSVRSLLRQTGAAIEYASTINDIGKAYKLSTEFVQGFAIASEAHNISLDQSSKAFRYLNVNLDRARSGAKAATRAFTTLGLSVRELGKMSTDDRMMKVLEAVGKLPVEQRAGALFSVGSEEFTRYAPMLQDPNYLKNLMGQIKGTGFGLSEDSAQSMRDLKTQLLVMERTWQGVLLGFLTEFSSDIGKVAKVLQDDIFPVMKESAEGILVAINLMKAVVASLPIPSDKNGVHNWMVDKTAQGMSWAIRGLSGQTGMDMVRGGEFAEGMQKNIETLNFSIAQARAEFDFLQSQFGFMNSPQEKSAAYTRQKELTDLLVGWQDQLADIAAMLSGRKPAGQAPSATVPTVPEYTLPPVDAVEKGPTQFQRFRVGWAETMKTMGEEFDKKWGEMEDIGKNSAILIAQAMSSAMNNFFFDAIDGKLKQFKEYLLSFLRDIARALTQVMTQRIVISALSGMGISAMPQTQPTGLSKASGFSQPNVTIMNNSGMPVEGSASMGTDNMGNAVMSIVLDAVSRNKGGSRSMLRGMLA